MAPGRAPQQPQMPQQAPKVNPMTSAGVSVNDMVSAYRGQPQQLEQRSGLPPDTLTALALQKIKSDLEAAQRQMQLQIGGQEGTVFQQREREVMDLTKNQLAQQRGATAQQQAKQQQASMQKLLGGVASAPGAAMAAQPKAMAAGGIVAFAEGDPVEDPRRARREGESFSDYRRRMFELDLQINQERKAAEAQKREEERLRRLAERGGEIIPPSPFLDRAPLPEPKPTATAAPAERPDFLAQINRVPGDAALRSAPVPFPPRAAPPAPPAPPAAATPPAPPAPPAAPPAPVAAPRVGPPTPLDAIGDATARAAMAQQGRDSAAERLDEERRIEQKRALTNAQRKVYEEGIAGLSDMYKRQFDPERQREQALLEFLTGAGGRRYGVLGAGARAALGYERGQSEAQRRAFEDLQKARTGLVELERKPIEEGIVAGRDVFGKAEAGKKEGITSGASLYGTSEQSRTAELKRIDDRRAGDLNRAVEKLKIEAQREASAAQRDATNVGRIQSAIGTALRNKEQAQKNVMAAYADVIEQARMRATANQNDKNAKRDLDNLLLERDAELDRRTREFDDFKDTLEGLLVKGISGAGNMPSSGYQVRKKD